MVEHQLIKLVKLLASKNKIIRNEVINCLARYPFSNTELLSALHDHLQNSLWDLRIVAADAIEAILSASIKNNFPDKNENNKEDLELYGTTLTSTKLQILLELDLVLLITKYKPLLRFLLKNFNFFKLIKNIYNLKNFKILVAVMMQLRKLFLQK